jgi:hypothetical protein
MKRYIKFLVLNVVLGLGLVSCNLNDETSNQRSEATDSIVAPQEVPINNYSIHFKNIIKSQAGTFRGVNLGTPISEVKKLEDTAQIVEETNDHIDYMLTLPHLENADLRYDLKDAKVSEIELNIYPKDENSQDSLFTEFDSYFTQKFGNAVTSDTASKSWENKQMDLLIKMEKKGNQKVHDIHIQFSSLMRQSAAILEESLPD